MTEQQPYQVLRRLGDVEIRHYPPAAIAEVTVPGSFEQAGTRAFGSLFGYISGRNLDRRSIAMTAPVIQASAEGDAHAVAFVLPSDLDAEHAPAPDNPEVMVRAVPATTTAALGYSGRWSQDSYDRHVTELLRTLASAGLATQGDPRFARYDPPFKPWFLRRNEVLVDLESDPDRTPGE